MSTPEQAASPSGMALDRLEQAAMYDDDLVPRVRDEAVATIRAALRAGQAAAPELPDLFALIKRRLFQYAEDEGCRGDPACHEVGADMESRCFPCLVEAAGNVIDNAHAVIDAALDHALCKSGQAAAGSAEPLNTLGREIIEINTANGWRVTQPHEWDGAAHPYKIPAILALIHSEASEALEAFRVGDRANFDEELADVLIRVLDCATGLGIDMDAAVRAKLARNRQRGYRHGGKAV